MARTSTSLWRRYQGLQALGQWGCIALGFVAAFHLDGHRILAASLFCGSVVGYLGLPRLAWRRIYLGAHRRFVEAFRRDDAVTARRVYDQLAAVGYNRRLFSRSVERRRRAPLTSARSTRPASAGTAAVPPRGCRQCRPRRRAENDGAGPGGVLPGQRLTSGAS